MQRNKLNDTELTSIYVHYMTGSYNKERTGLIFSRNHPSPPENKKAIFSPSWLWCNRKYSFEWVQDMWKLAGSQKSGSYFPIQHLPGHPWKSGRHMFPFPSSIEEQVSKGNNSPAWLEFSYSIQ